MIDYIYYFKLRMFTIACVCVYAYIIMKLGAKK